MIYISTTMQTILATSEFWKVFIGSGQYVPLIELQDSTAECHMTYSVVACQIQVHTEATCGNRHTV